MTEEFKEISNKARAKQQKNLHPHYLGSAGYAGKTPEWLVADPISSQSSCASISSTLAPNDRGLDWIRARSRKGDDGKYYIPNEKTRGVIQKIVEKCEDVNKGSFKPSRHQDVLSEALGKKEHPGSVRGVGAYVAVKKVFGKPMKSKERSRGVLPMDDVEALVEKVRQETILAMQPTIDSLNNQLQDLMKRMPQEYPENVRASMGTPQSVYKPVDPLVGRSSCQSVDPYPFALIESPTPCRLALCTGKDTIVVVARGIVHPTQFDTLVHNTLVLPNHVKVSVDHVIVEGGETFLLPVPSQYHTHIGDVIGSFVQWPTHLVGIGEEEIVMKSKVEKNYDCGEESGTRLRANLIDDVTLQLLGVECKRLHNVLLAMPIDCDYFELKVDYNIFPHTNMKSIFVMTDDIKDLLTMQWLNVSIIQVFIMYLHKLCNQFGIDSIGFLCPTQIAKATLDLNFNAVTAYIANTMVTLKDKTLIFAPYHQSQHWLLLVVNVCSKTVYVFDPMKCDRDIEIKAAVNMAFRSYMNQLGQRAKDVFNFKHVKCPQQPGGVECGYYVMKYMLELCTKYSTFTSLDEGFQDTMAYSIEEIDEIREIWAKYFYNECV